MRIRKKKKSSWSPINTFRGKKKKVQLESYQYLWVTFHSSLLYIFLPVTYQTHSFIYWPDFLCFRRKFLGFPGGSAEKHLPANAGDMGLIPVLGRSPGGGNGNPPQYSCLENPMDRGTW